MASSIDTWTRRWETLRSTPAESWPNPQDFKDEVEAAAADYAAAKRQLPDHPDKFFGGEFKVTETPNMTYRQYEQYFHTNEKGIRRPSREWTRLRNEVAAAIMTNQEMPRRVPPSTPSVPPPPPPPPTGSTTTSKPVRVPPAVSSPPAPQNQLDDPSLEAPLVELKEINLTDIFHFMSRLKPQELTKVMERIQEKAEGMKRKAEREFKQSVQKRFKLWVEDVTKMCTAPSGVSTDFVFDAVREVLDQSEDEE